MLTRGIIRLGINTRVGMRNTTSSSRRSASGGPIFFEPGGEMTGFAYKVVTGGLTGLGGGVAWLLSLGYSLDRDVTIIKTKTKNVETTTKEIREELSKLTRKLIPDQNKGNNSQ